MTIKMIDVWDPRISVNASEEEGNVYLTVLAMDVEIANVSLSVEDVARLAELVGLRVQRSLTQDEKMELILGGPDDEPAHAVLPRD